MEPMRWKESETHEVARERAHQKAREEYQRQLDLIIDKCESLGGVMPTIKQIEKDSLLNGEKLKIVIGEGRWEKAKIKIAVEWKKRFGTDLKMEDGNTITPVKGKNGGEAKMSGTSDNQAATVPTTPITQEVVLQPEPIAQELTEEEKALKDLVAAYDWLPLKHLLSMNEYRKFVETSPTPVTKPYAMLRVLGENGKEWNKVQRVLIEELRKRGDEGITVLELEYQNRREHSAKIVKSKAAKEEVAEKQPDENIHNESETVAEIVGRTITSEELVDLVKEDGILCRAVKMSDCLKMESKFVLYSGDVPINITLSVVK